MSVGPLFTERRDGAPAPTHQTVPVDTRDALVSLAQRKITADWLAQEFPTQCPDGNNVAGTDLNAVGRDLRARVGCDWPLFATTFDDSKLFDLLEYVASRAALPIPGRDHAYFNHRELTFNERDGKNQFRGEVNTLLRAGAMAYEMASSLQIEHIAAPETQQILNELRPHTGDATLDGLLEQARALFRSRREADRGRALEKLWDGFERLKTIDVPGKKAASVAALLAHLPDVALRAVVEQEMRALTDIGNSFQIRHWEAGKHPVIGGAEEYLAGRLANLIVLLLRSSNRLAR